MRAASNAPALPGVKPLPDRPERRPSGQMPVAAPPPPVEHGRAPAPETPGAASSNAPSLVRLDEITAPISAAAAGGGVPNAPTATAAEMSGPVFFEGEATITSVMRPMAVLSMEREGELVLAQMKLLFNVYVETRRQLGERTDNLEVERFMNKLRQNAADLIARYKCKSVRFQVYIKDGKAALKATPQK
jgi:hypothetical protein